MIGHPPRQPRGKKEGAEMKKFLEKMRKDEKGQGLVEYALIIVLVSIAVIAMLSQLGLDIGAVFTQISGELTKGAGS
jgi:pilus assembly protein Flp/PilA